MSNFYMLFSLLLAFGNIGYFALYLGIFLGMGWWVYLLIGLVHAHVGFSLLRSTRRRWNF